MPQCKRLIRKNKKGRQSHSRAYGENGKAFERGGSRLLAKSSSTKWILKRNPFSLTPPKMCRKLWDKKIKCVSYLIDSRNKIHIFNIKKKTLNDSN